MISYIKGFITDIETDRLIIESNGIGYNIFVPSSLINKSSISNEIVKIYTYLCVREDSMTLFGFSSKEELRLFRQLIGVNGIGPKGALGILSIMTVDELILAIISDDSKAISKAPGIGAKTASKLILELKDKVSLEDSINSQQSDGLTTDLNENSIKKDALEALVSLGYSPSQAMSALRKIEINDSSDISSIIKLALKNII